MTMRRKTSIFVWLVRVVPATLCTQPQLAARTAGPAATWGVRRILVFMTSYGGSLLDGRCGKNVE